LRILRKSSTVCSTTSQWTNSTYTDIS